MTLAQGSAGAVLTVDLTALQNNYRYLAAQLGQARCGAAVKADAYGLGAAQVATALYSAACRDFFVAHLHEAISLRRSLPSDAALYVMHGSPVGHEAEFLQHQCIPVLNSLQQIKAWGNLACQQQRALPAIVQFDTGMARMGLDQQETQQFLSQPELRAGIQIHYLMSHLSVAERKDHELNQLQLQRMQEIRAALPGIPASFANSSGIFLGAAFQMDLVRPGAALYGVNPHQNQVNPMQAVAYLQGRIIQTREIAAGVGVGYGGSWVSSKPSRIATVGVGYADGWLRSLSNRGWVEIAGHKVAMVGNVSMDTITLDVSEIPVEHLQEGALVDLLSDRITVDQVAQQAGTIGYEILTSLGARYERQYRQAETA